jgi:glycine/D-amino acid oxidase-like deaminating enzyme/ABC-type branched-subunit amino acid transport system substrate-binding protein
LGPEASGGRERASVAVVGPFTGPRAAWGKLLQEAAATRGDAVRWRFFDDEGDADVARDRGRDVISEGGHAAVIGHFNSLGASATLPLYASAEMPVLLPLATRPGLLAHAGGWALRFCPDDAAQAAAICRKAAADRQPELIVMHDGTQYGRELAACFEALTSTPITISTEDASGRPPATAAVVLCGAHHTVAALVQRIRAGGHRGPLIVTDDCQVAEFRHLAGQAADEALVARMTGSAAGRVDEAFSALASALEEDPRRRGAKLLAAVRRGTARAFGPSGDLLPTAEDPGWEVVPLFRSRDPRGAGRRDFHCDVAIVGSGVVGAALAACLSESAASVVVIDPGSTEEMASGFSGGLVRAFEPGRASRDMALRSSRLLWGRGAAATAHGFQQTGALTLLGVEDLADARDGVDTLRAAGIDATLISADDVQGRWPAVSVGGIAGAVWEPGGGYADAMVTVTELMASAQRCGATVCTGRVRAIVPSCDGSARLVCEDHDVLARVAVVAAGCGAPGLLAGRLPLGIKPRSKRIRYAFFDHPSCTMPSVVDLATGLWGRPAGDSRFLVGVPVAEWDVRATGGTTVTSQQVAEIRRRAKALLPWIATAAAHGGRFGADLFVEGSPAGPRTLWGVLPDAPPTIVAAGWSGAGFKIAPAIAERTAAAALAMANGHSGAARPEWSLA